MAGNFIEGMATPGNDALIRRIEDIERTLRELPPSVAKSVTEIVASQVGVAGGSNSATNFDLNTTYSWRTVATTSVTPPAWANAAVVTASGVAYLVANTEFAEPNCRLSIAGVNSMEYEFTAGIGASALPFAGAHTFTRSLSGLAGEPIECEIQLLAENGDFFTGSGNRKAEINMTAVFTR